MAIRNDKPAVHFFTMYHIKGDSDSVIDPTKKIHITRDPELLERLYNQDHIGLAAPRAGGKGRPSWIDGNISTYLEDSGLWTACYESRERMLRHFRSCEIDPQASRRVKLGRKTTRHHGYRPLASLNMEFTRDNGERQYLTVRPSTDLICLRLLEGSKLSFGSHPLPDWRNIERRRDHEGRSWYSNTSNVAVEYDPAWHNPDIYGRISDVIAAFGWVHYLRGLENFWFIDYRLTRKFKKDREGERKMFHAGRLTFIEVSIDDSEWCCCPKQGCSDQCLHRLGFIPPGAHDLANDLYTCHRQGFNAGPYGSRSRPTRSRPTRDYGVLACDDLESQGKLPTVRKWRKMNKRGPKRVYA